jgi:hypothetical protein
MRRGSMNEEVVVLRLLHIVPGVLWVGGAVIFAWVIEPRIRALGPEIAGPVMGSVGKVLSPILLSLGGITIVVGFVLIDRTPGKSYDQLFDTSWGWAIGLGLVTSLIGYGFGLAGARTVRKLLALIAAAEGPPSPEDIAERMRLSAQSRMLVRTASVFIVIAVGTMASATWV